MNGINKMDEMKNRYYVDLHLHTTYSDGSASPPQVVVDTAMLGMNVISITDHDTIDGYAEAESEAEKWNIDILRGVEISTKKYHILGYDFNPENKTLQEVLNKSRTIQLNIATNRIGLIRDSGMPITLDKVLYYSKSSRIGKGNITKAMLMDPECRQYAGGLSFDELHEKYFSKKSPAANIQFDIYHERLPSSKEAINAIHSAGGIAVIAHPFKDVKDMSELDILLSEGIDGLEIQPNYNERNALFREYALNHGMLITFGSDYHGSRNRKRPLLCKSENYVQRFWKIKEENKEKNFQTIMDLP